MDSRPVNNNSTRKHTMVQQLAAKNRQRAYFQNNPINMIQTFRKYPSMSPTLYYENLNLTHLRWLYLQQHKTRGAEILSRKHYTSDKSLIITKEGQQIMRATQKATLYVKKLPDGTTEIRPPPPSYVGSSRYSMYLAKPFVPILSFRLSWNMRLEDVAHAVSGYQNKVTAFQPFGGEWYYIRQEKEFGWNRAVESFGHCEAKCTVFTRAPYGSGVMRVKRQEDFWAYY